MRIDCLHAFVLLWLTWESSARPMPPKRAAPRSEFPVISISREPNTRSSFKNWRDSDESVLMRNRSPKRKPASRPISPMDNLDNFKSLSVKENPWHKSNAASALFANVVKPQIPNKAPATVKPTNIPKQLPDISVSEFKPGRFTLDYDHILGKGAYGSVYRGLSENNEPIAVKVIDVEEMAKRDQIIPDLAVELIYIETDACQALKHKNILQCTEPKFDNKFTYAKIATELCDGGDFSAKIDSKKVSKAEAQCNFWQLLSGLEFMHSKDFVHRDIKPENLLFKKSGLLKIGDLGLARKLPLDAQETDDIPGTPSFMPPEVFPAPSHITMHPYNPYAADIWSSAITYIQSRTFQLPWDVARFYIEKFQDYKQDPRMFLQSLGKDSSQGEFSEEEITVLLKMLAYDPSQRISAKALMDLAWIQKLKDQCPPSVIVN